jgi:phage tail sheath protein FI
MAINPTSAPGLYIVELPSNAHAVQAAPKSIAVFVGYTHPYKTRHFKTAVAINSFTDFERQFGGLYASGVVDRHLPYAVMDFFLNGGAQSYVVGLEPHYRDNVNADLGLVKAFPAKATIGNIEFSATELTDMIPMKVTIDNVNSTSDTADISITYGPTIETYRAVSINATLPSGKPNPNFIEARLANSSLVTVKHTGANYGVYTAASGTAFVASLPAGITTTFDAADFAAVFQADTSLDLVDVFNLLLLPGISDTTVCSAALSFAERKLAFVIMDPPVQAAADDLGGLPTMQDLIDNVPKSQNGAIYFPYLQTFDPLTASPMDLPPSGFVAGKIAESDQVGPWLAPAGLSTIINGTIGVVARGRLTDPRLGVLNFKGVNCLRSVPGIGTVIWGARTLVAENVAFQQWKYITVRRMALFIEQSLKMSLGWAVFQPNDDPLYLALRNTVSSFMLSLFNSGAFEGATPSQAFKVVCDRTTTTDDDRTLGICNILVAFRPLKPAEFVVIKVAQLAGQATA